MRANRVLKLAVAYTLAAASSVALAQTPPASGSAATELDTVIVTGSYIKGSAEDAALPVDVISSEDLLKQGSPSTLDILKQLPVSNGVLGDSNQFDARAQGSEGSGSVNLRGLGPTRTLVLMNGRRMVNSPFTGAPDTNLLPTAAIGRLEVLKDGAAATYGSDAIAGVVNFITKTGKNSPGFEAFADYKYIQDSDGDYTAGLNFGHAGEGFDFFLSAGYEHRSELLAKDRDWATRPYMDNPQGGYSAAGNPASYLPLTSTGALAAGVTRDPGCAPLGGTPGITGAATPVCYWQYTKFDALTEKEDRYQVYGEFNTAFGETKFHLEGLYASTDIPIYRTSPSYAALQTPSTPVPGQYFVPASNPGYQAMLTAYPSSGLLANGAGALMIAYRPFAIGGNPLFDYGSSKGPRNYDAYRFSAGLSGSFGSFADWDVAVTYMSQTNHREGRDTVVNRLQLALNGFGGPNCTGAVAGSAANGCSWLNPFSVGIPANAITGATTGLPVVAPNSNLAMIDWMFPVVSTDQKSDITVVDAVLNGESSLSLPGGAIGWAFGGQFRDTGFKTEYSDLNNFAVTPCVNSIATTPPGGIVGPSGCTAAQLAAPAGALLFLGGSNNVDFSQNVYGIFGELSLPILDNLQAQVAVRYEDYGSPIGNTVNPKLGVKWDIADFVALRGSVGTTFRGPTAANVSPGTVTSLQAISGTFRAIRTAGNPDLQPESALTMNFGVIFKMAGFTGTLDYWSFDMDDQIVNEPVAGISGTFFQTHVNSVGATVPDHCGEAAYAGLQSRFTFNASGCGSANIVRLDNHLINGPNLKTSGIDLGLTYALDSIDLEFGLNTTYTLEYKTGDLFVEGQLVQAAFDAVGKLNYQTTAYPIPKVKGLGFIQYTRGVHNLRWQSNYVGSYVDQRTDIFTATPATNNTVIAGGKTIEATTLHSLYYNLQLPSNIGLSLSIENIFDTDPSFARLDYSYDPFTGSAFGRTYKAGFRVKF